MTKLFKEKFNEALVSIIPIAAIIIAICAFIVPVSVEVFVLFIIGVIFLIVGMALFSIGADQSMITIGNKIGAKLTRSRSVWIIAFISLLIGIIITFTEPDLQILALQVSAVPNLVFIVAVSCGVGIFLMIAMLRILFRIPLNILLIGFYIIAFVVCIFVPADFHPVGFDAGGVTTGPMTVPFMLAIGMGVTSVRIGKSSQDDSFGIIALASIGPIIAVLVLGIFYKVEGTEYVLNDVVIVESSRDIFREFGLGTLDYLGEVGLALLPMALFFFVFQLITKSFSRVQVYKILIGLFIVYIGLALFLTGANIGFLHMGYELGGKLAGIGSGVVFIIIGLIIGFFLVQVEPAVHVLTKQVERVTIGAISAKTMGLGLSFGVSVAIGLSVLRLLTGLPIIWILIPGYIIAIALSFFVPKIITGIAFDSGGVASGIMVSAFILPMMIGGALALEVNVMTQAFGCVSLVALAPIISVEVSGLVYAKKAKRAMKKINLEEDLIIEYV